MSMMKKQYILIIAYLFIFINSNAQSFNFSQYQDNSFVLGPANMGEHNRLAKFSMIYRNQWYKVSDNPYKTYGTALEASLFKKRLFVGGQLITDEAGAGNLKLLQSTFQIASKVRINNRNYLKIGVQSNYNIYSVNTNNFSWNSQYDGVSINPNMPSGENFDKETFTNFNFTTGALWVYENRNEDKLKLGLSVRNILSTNTSFYSSSDKSNNLSIAMNGSYEFRVNDFYYSPSFYIERFNNNSYNIKYGAYIKSEYGSQSRYTNYKNLSEVYYGLFFRNFNAITPQIRYSYERKFEIVFGFDFDVSTFHEATGYQGAAEMGLNYMQPEKAIRSVRK